MSTRRHRVLHSQAISYIAQSGGPLLTCNHDIGITNTDHPKGIPYAVGTSGAGCAGSVVRPLQAMLYADRPGSHVGQDSGDKERIDAT